MNVQWYPGHMTKARRQMSEDMKLIDLVIELTDARIPCSSRNPDIDELAKGKSRILLLNKKDLSDPAANEKWKQYFESRGILTTLVNSQRGEGIQTVRSLIEQACREKTERDRKRGILNRPVRAMVCGIPNVGKSAFINSFAGKAAAKTGNRPGVTRGKQWIRLNPRTELLDTPGILWPKFEDPEVGIRLALAGSVKDELTDSAELAKWLLIYLKERYPLAVKERYNLENPADPQEDFPALLTQIALARGAVKKEQEADLERAAFLLVDDFRKGKLGKISLEFPEPTD